MEKLKMFLDRWPLLKRPLQLDKYGAKCRKIQENITSIGESGSIMAIYLYILSPIFCLLIFIIYVISGAFFHCDLSWALKIIRVILIEPPPFYTSNIFWTFAAPLIFGFVWANLLKHLIEPLLSRYCFGYFIGSMFACILIPYLRQKLILSCEISAAIWFVMFLAWGIASYELNKRRQQLWKELQVKTEERRQERLRQEEEEERERKQREWIYEQKVQAQLQHLELLRTTFNTEFAAYTCNFNTNLKNNLKNAFAKYIKTLQAYKDIGIYSQDTIRNNKEKVLTTAIEKINEFKAINKPGMQALEQLYSLIAQCESLIQTKEENQRLEWTLNRIKQEKKEAAKEAREQQEEFEAKQREFRTQQEKTFKEQEESIKKQQKDLQEQADRISEAAEQIKKFRQDIR